MLATTETIEAEAGACRLRRFVTFASARESLFVWEQDPLKERCDAAHAAQGWPSVALLLDQPMAISLAETIELLAWVADGLYFTAPKGESEAARARRENCDRLCSEVVLGDSCSLWYRMRDVATDGLLKGKAVRIKIRDEAEAARLRRQSGEFGLPVPDDAAVFVIVAREEDVRPPLPVEVETAPATPPTPDPAPLQGKDRRWTRTPRWLRKSH